MAKTLTRYRLTLTRSLFSRSREPEGKSERFDEKEGMKWYQLYKLSALKMASITFSLQDSHKIAQPMTLMNLSSDLVNSIWYKYKLTGPHFSPYTTDADIDGKSSFEDTTGVINFYVKANPNCPNPDPQDYAKAIDTWIADKQEDGFIIERGQNPEKSKLLEVPVFRIKVIQNPTSELEELPYLNMAEANAYAMLTLLSLEPSGGSISAAELKQRIAAVTPEGIQEAQAPSGWLQGPDALNPPDPADNWKGNSPVGDQPPKGQGAQIFMGGRDENYIDSRLQGLYSLADYAETNGFQQINWG